MDTPRDIEVDATATLATLLRHYRAQAGLTQEELAERADLSVRAISDLERGVKRRPHRTTVDLLVGALALSSGDRRSLDAAVRRNQSVTPIPHVLDAPIGGYLGAVPDRPMVARVAEVEATRRLLREVREGRGETVLLSGDPGVGKTRLAQEMTLICRADGMYPVSGRCYEHQQHVPYFPFSEIVGRLVPVARATLAIDPPARWPSLAALLPDAPPQPAAGGDHRRVVHAIADLMAALAESRPLLIALDDLHWADPSSLYLVEHLARHVRGMRVLLLGTYREAHGRGERRPGRHAAGDHTGARGPGLAGTPA